ncbi:NAD(P)H-binding protein [Halanaeroarchaeum sp. HSR-CO]|uniref:NAD(P)H-binding protein n=1 Tax=Halanaeroarchaeum sp. HSR-CO TaxID=2866382 RepID=UPI00217D2F82|nr:NAD(P)H-binding protein [Halanaeroarchaeum sp. HSR-CO]
MQVLVTGATGFVGSHLVPALLAAGHDVRALVRDETRYDGPEAVTLVEADLLDASSLEGAFDGCEAAYYLVHSMGAAGDFEEKDRRAARNFAEKASEAGVSQVVYLGGLGGEDGTLSEHLRSRREVEAVLEGGEYDLTVFRAAIVVGAESSSFRIVAALTKRLPVMITPEWVRTRSQPIYVDDVVAYLAGAIETDAARGRTFEIGGPEVLTYQQMMQRTAAALGRRLFVIPVPVLTPRLSAYWVDLVTDVPASVAHPLIEGLKNPVVVNDDSVTDVIEVDLTPFDEAVRKTLTEMGEPVVDG